MRGILFRGQKLNCEEWVYGLLAKLSNSHYAIIREEHRVDFLSEQFLVAEFTEVDPNTIGQYTGLTDKNGSKIFDGDILSYTVEGTTDYYEVKIDDGSVRFGELAECLDQQYASQFEVFSNIHDNPLIGPSC